MSYIWHNVRDFGVEGKGWDDTEPFYGRLPVKAKAKVRDIIWDLGHCSAGISARFKTNAAEIRVRWKMSSDILSKFHTPLRAYSGIDLYARAPDDKWLWVGTTKEIDSNKAESTILTGIPERMHEYLIYLPLFNPVEEMEIGVLEGSTFEGMTPRRQKPILYYGTSIVHGAGVTRPGMAHASILGRRLDYPLLNMGFSGNARMEPEVAELLAELDPVLYILDPLPNMSADMVKENAESFINTICKTHPDVPVIMVEDRTYPAGWLLPDLMNRNDSCRAEFKIVYERLISSAMKKLYYVKGEKLLGDDGDGTADGSHPSDLGAVRMVDILEPLVRSNITCSAIHPPASTQKTGGFYGNTERF